MYSASGNSATSKEEIQKLKEELVKKEHAKKVFEALSDQTYDLDLTQQGTGLDAYFKKEIVRHFRKDTSVSGTLVRLRLLDGILRTRCSVIKNTQEVQGLVDYGYFDIGTNENPALIIKPNKTDDE